MDNLKSIILSTFPSTPAFFYAIESPGWLTIVSSIVLPVLFFCLSKAVDVFVQIYLKRKK